MSEPSEEDILGEITQKRHLEGIVARARRLTEKLGALQRTNGHRVHFRPTAVGVDMVGLLPERPFAVRPAIKSLGRFVQRFEDEFRQYCVEVPAARTSVEKRLQAFLIRDAYSNRRRLSALNAASQQTDTPVELVFVTDDVSMPFAGKRFACDLLALWENPSPHAVVIEVGKTRGNPVNIQRVRDYAAIVQRQRAVFAELFSALLDRDITLEPDCHRWILWPAGDPADGMVARLAQDGIRLAEFEERPDHFAIRAGQAV